MKKFLMFFLVFTLSLALFACGTDTTCTSHTDDNSDGKCDTCGSEVNNNENNNTASAIDLIKDGAVNFQIVRQSNIGGGVMMLLNTLKADVERMGSTLDIVDDKAGSEKDIEILVGDVNSRGEKYTYDKYSLGMEGYIIKMVDNKVLINAGSQDQLVDAVEEFIKDILGIKSTTKTLPDVTMTSSKEVLKIQDDYRVTSITINGAEINGYTIAYDQTAAAHQAAASSLNKFLYENAGYYLPLVKLEDAGKSIIIEAVDYAGEDGFLVKTEESGALRIQCAYDNKFEEAFNAFFSNELRLKSGDIAFDSSYNYTYEVSVVYYDDYLHLSQNGNDYPALKAAHDFANQCGQTVKATSGKKYYVGLLGTNTEDGVFVYQGTIIVKTNVDWGRAEFIIDDTDIGPINENSRSKTNVFTVDSDHWYSSVTLEGDAVKEVFPGSVGPTTTSINWSADYPVMMVLYNSNHQDHIRYGGDYSTRGRDQKEIIVVDENGNLDMSARLLYDFTEVTSALVHRIDDSPIAISGGTFTTLASQVPVSKTGSDSDLFLSRGINVRRSNTLIKDVKHYVKNELPGTSDDTKGVSYNSFFGSYEAVNIVFENCVLTARRYYNVAGTYDFSTSLTNNVTLKGCTQSNFHLEGGVNSQENNRYWGCGVSNAAKNLIYDNTMITRFDAHASLFGGKIINNSYVTTINLIGGGDMLIENSTIESVNPQMISLRSDYGATWNGTVTIRNTKVLYNNSTTKVPAEMSIFRLPWANHYFGYVCHMPNLVLDNLTFETNFKEIHILSSSGNSNNSSAPLRTAITEPNLHLDTLTNGEINKNPIVPPLFIELKNNNAGMVYKIWDVPFFENTNIIGNIIKVSYS